MSRHDERSPVPRALIRAGALLCVSALLVGTTPDSALADDDAARELAERHAPSFRLKEQSGPCDTDGEAFEPTAVDIVIGNDDVLLRQAGVGDPVVTRGPTAADLYGRGEGFFLDFNGLALEPECVYERDFANYTDDLDSVVYAHVAQQDDEPDQLVVQYWIYWYFNDWNNKHESDWEFIQLLFNASTPEEALTQDPVSVGYAQHEGGERASWDDDKLERVGDRPVVYSSAGSHASYYASTIHLGRSASEGFGCDTTTGPSRTVDPAVILLPTEATSATDEFAWLEFDGRWGERHGGPFNGPTGPTSKDQWLRPIDWHDDLRSSSVEIPGGDENNATALTTFCSVVDFGSNQLRAVQVSPLRLIVVLVAGGLGLRFAARRTEWTGVPAVPLRHRRRVGQMLRTAATSAWITRGALTLLGLVYVPAAVIVAVVGAIGSYNAATAVAGVLTTVMYGLSVALVSAYWHLARDERDRPVLPAMRLIRSRATAIALTALRASAIVFILGFSIVGMPWAIRQLVRYQFAVPIAATEGLSGAAALARSSELVAGRWWRTAFTVGTFVAIAFVLNSALQILLLIGFSGLALWLFVAVAFLITGLIVPMAATAPVLLYGDAAAEFVELAHQPAENFDGDPINVAT